VFVRLGVVGAEEIAAAKHPEAVRGILLAAVDASEGELRKHLDDAFVPERVRWEMTLGVSDFAAEARDALPAGEPRVLAPETVLWVAPFVRVVRVKYDWDAWLAAGGREAPGPLPGELLLYRRENRIHERPLGALAAAVLEALKEPLTLQALERRLLSVVEEVPELGARVEAQVRAAIAAGLVRCAIPNPRETARIAVAARAGAGPQA
jgi:hypothetical protein